MILVRSSMLAEELWLDAEQQAEIYGINITVGSAVITVCNLYKPLDRDLSLYGLVTTSEGRLAVGDFSGHSCCWGCAGADHKGDGVEGW